jgi:uncharacterized glyoxalase superfamily protein PhnB
MPTKPNAGGRTMKLYTQLNFGGNCEEAFRFYEKAERVHNLLAEGGEIYMPMEETFYATRFSMLRDRFGVSWSIIHETQSFGTTTGVIGTR